MQRHHRRPDADNPRARRPIRRNPPQHSITSAIPSLAPVIPRQPMQSRRRQQTKRPPKKIQMPPSVVDIGLQYNSDGNGQGKAAQQQNQETQFAGAQRCYGAPKRPPADRRRPGPAQQQRHRRARNAEPDGYIMRRHFVRHCDSPQEKVEYLGRMLGKYLDPFNNPERIFPQERTDDVKGKHSGRHKSRAGDNNALAPLRFPGEPPVQAAHRQYHWQQHQAKNTHIGCNGDDHAAQSKRPQRILAKCPVRKIQRNHKHNRKGRILAIKERMGIQPGMQQKQEHRQ